jgi:hypothetical protein
MILKRSNAMDNNDEEKAASSAPAKIAISNNPDPPIIKLFILIKEKAENGHTFASLKQYILSHAIDLNQRHLYFEDLTLIYAIANSAGLVIFKGLVEELNVDISALDNRNLFYSAIGNLEILDYLSNPETKLYERFNDGTTALDAAAVRGDWDYIDKALAENQNTIFPEDKLKAIIPNDDDEDEKQEWESQPQLQNMFFWAGLVGQ